MAVRALYGPEAPPPVVLGSSRSAVLAALRQAGRPLDVQQVAAAVGLHANTVRFHLERLAASGLVNRAREDRTVPGRPRAQYSPAHPSTGGRRSYRLLAEILASSVAAGGNRRTQAPWRAGRSWGRHLVEPPRPGRRPDADGATRELVSVMREIGFDPEPVTAGRRREILLRHCPFLEVALEHPEVVCEVHLGLAQGVLEELEAPLRVTRLEQFARPHVCAVHLAAARPAGPPAAQAPGVVTVASR